jgi:hypothetical protein
VLWNNSEHLFLSATEYNLLRLLGFHWDHSFSMAIYCGLCDKTFDTPRALYQHQQTSARHKRYCHSCERDFDLEWGLTQHYTQSPHHHYCQSCEEHFDSQSDLNNHLEDEHHYCKSCGKVSIVGFIVRRLPLDYSTNQYW